MMKRTVSSTSRRTLLKWGLCGLGAVALMNLPKSLTAQASNVKTLIFNAGNIGILNVALLLEELEAVFYARVVKSRRITKGTLPTC